MESDSDPFSFDAFDHADSMGLDDIANDMLCLDDAVPRPGADFLSDRRTALPAASSSMGNFFTFDPDNKDLAVPERPSTSGQGDEAFAPTSNSAPASEGCQTRKRAITTSAQGDSVYVKLEECDTAPVKEKRRRRRLRNAKQQELNRLAQQRYRERKKQKYTSLQSAVDELAQRLEELTTLQAENAALHTKTEELQHALDDSEELLSAQKRTVGAQRATIASQSATIASQNAQLQQQAAQLAAQAAQLTELQQKLAATTAAGAADAANAPTTAAGSSRTSGAAVDSTNEDSVCDVMAASITAAIMEARDPAADPRVLQSHIAKLPDSVVTQISRTICRCCREMEIGQPKKQFQPETAKTIQVPCC